jgi:glycerophosphoryl diester phosphodiesterase
MSDWLVHRAGRPLNIAHRGGVDAYGTDLFDAVSRSVAAGADAIEIDVQTTKDQQFVVFHDRFLRTPTGLRRLDALTLEEAGLLPLLADVLRHARALGVRVLLDLKSNDAAERLVQLVMREQAAEQIAVASFHYRPLVALAALGTSIPGVATIGLARAMGDAPGFLWTVYALGFPIRAARAVKAQALLCRARRVSAGLVDAAHAEGLALLAWDVTPSTDLHRLVAWGIDGIVADDPRTVSAAIDVRPSIMRSAADDRE